VVVTLNGVNDAPTSANGSFSTAFGTPKSGSLPTASDVDTGHSVSYAKASDPAHGTVSINANGSYTYTPAAGYSGTDSFNFQVNDGRGGTNIYTMTITIAPNVPAVFSGSDTGSVTEDSGNYVASGSLVVSDSDGANTLVAKTIAGTYGSFTVSTNGAWSYTADNNKLQPLSTTAQTQESFVVNAADGTPHTVVVTLNGVNDAPTSANGSFSTAFGTPKSGSLPTASDVDTGHSVSYAKASDPAHGTVSINANGSYTYTPAAGYSGTDSFNFQVNDGRGGTNIYTMTITIAPNVPAVFSGSDTGSVTEDSGNYVASGSLVVSDSDGANTLVAKTIAGTYGSFTVSTNGAWNYTADNNKLQPLSTTAQTQESFVVNAADGTAHTVVITLIGADEVIPPNLDTVTPIPQTEVPGKPAQADSPAVNPVSSPSSNVSVSPINDSIDPVRAGEVIVSQDGRGNGFVGDHLLTVADNKAFPIVVTKSSEPVLLLFSGIADQAVNPQSGLVGFNVPADAFTHSNPKAVVQLHASLANGDNLPKWLNFDATTGRFSGLPPSDADDDIQVQVIARDTDGREARAVFRIRLGRSTDVLEKNPQAGRSSFSQQLRLAARYAHAEGRDAPSTYRSLTGK
jgi:VCBS repeat-containing protein